MSHVWPASNMASFDMAASMTASYSVPGNQPIKRLEPSIHKFIKIAIPTDLDRLNHHRRNIERYRKTGAFDKLNGEQNNARRTVQQLKANMREMEKARSQIREEDHPEFDRKVTPVKQEAISAIVQFIELCGTELDPFEDLHDGAGRADDAGTTMRHRHTEEQDDNQDVIPDNSSDNKTHQDTLADHISNTTEHDGTVQQQIQAHKQLKEAEDSWVDLKGDLEQLNTVIHEFATHVNSQQEKVDNITDNIDQASLNVRSGTTMLAKASKLKAVMLPLGGAIIGGALGGPVGLYAGMKIGAMAAFGGGAVGFVSGRLLKKKQDKQVQMELDTLSDDNIKRRTSERTDNASDTVARKDE